MVGSIFTQVNFRGVTSYYSLATADMYILDIFLLIIKARENGEDLCLSTS